MSGTSNNRMARYLGNTAGGLGLSIRAFPGRFQRVWLREDERYHAVESLFCASAHIKAVFRTVFISNLSIVFDTVRQ